MNYMDLNSGIINAYVHSGLNRNKVNALKYLNKHYGVEKFYVNVFPDLYLPNPPSVISSLNKPVFIEIKNGYGKLTDNQKKMFSMLSKSIPIFILRIFNRSKVVKLFRIRAESEVFVSNLNLFELDDKEVLERIHKKYPGLDNEPVIK